MLKNLSQIDEINESHKKNGYTMNAKMNKEIIKKEENNNKNKLINPKYIFEKKPKNYKNTNSTTYRSPNENNKMPTIKETGY